MINKAEEKNMDAVQNLFKKTALFLVMALAAAIPGRAQPAFTAPSNISLSGSGGQDVTIGSTGAAISFSHAIVYSGGDPSWLTVSGSIAGCIPAGSFCTPTILNFIQSGAGLLSQGTHTATVTLHATDASGAAPVNISVTYTTGFSGGGGSSTLTATPNPIVLNAAVNSFASTNVALTTSSTTAITILQVTNNGSGWLSATLNGSNSIVAGNGTGLTVQCNSFGLTNNTSYSATVTITPSTGTALGIPVTCNVGAGGSGGLTATPSTISWNYNTNSGVYPSQTVGLSSTALYYSATATSSNGWLLVNGQSSVAGASIVGGMPVGVLGANINALATASYIGYITVTDSNGGTATITVNLTVNGGNSTGLTISPGSLFFTSAVGGATLQGTLTVTSSIGGSVSVTGTGTGWLFGLPNSSPFAAGVPGTITVYVTPSGLAQNTYTGTLLITVGSQTATVPVTLQLGSGGSGGGSTTTNVAPNALTLSYQAGTNAAFVARPKIAITGPQGSWSSNVSMSNGTGWLALSPSSGTSLPDQATVLISPTLLTVGSYSGTIAVTTPGGTQTISVTLSVYAGAVLLPTPGSVVFEYQVGGAAPTPQVVFFGASDASPVAITATASDTWITVNATGSSMSISVDPAGKSAGVYAGSVSITQSGVSNSPLAVPVVLVVNGGGGIAGPLTFVPTSLQFSSVNGATPLAQTVSVSASTQISFTASAGVQNGSTNWLSVNPLSGITNQNVQVSVNPAGLLAATYNGTITFTANGVNQSLPVSLTVSSSGTSTFTVSPASLSFSGQAAAGTPAAQTLAVLSASGASGVGFTVAVTSGTWLSVLPLSGSTPFNTPGLTVNANTTGLAAGTYNGNIQITPTAGGGLAVNVPVALTVTAAPTVVSATPVTLSFAYRAGDAAPASQSIAVSGGGGTLPFSATASSNGNWLSVSPASGTTPAAGAAAVDVSVNPVNLAGGDYQGTVTIAGTGAATGTTSIVVTLKVTAPLPTITRLTNAGSFASGTIAPGEIVTLFGVNIGPATPAGLALDSSGKVATSIGGTQVLVNGIPAPITFASATQVNAVVPYELAGFATANVLVRFLSQTSNGVPVNVATTAPGLFTLNSSGTGPAAILNSNNSINSPSNPANRGDTVVIYMTGEGQTTPAGVTGKVTTVSAVPPLTPAPLLLVSVLIGGQGANYTFAGEAPGFVSGVMQLNVTIPTNIAAGDQSLVVSIGGNPSQSGVTVSVR